jgi:hypothetical protein
MRHFFTSILIIGAIFYLNAENDNDTRKIDVPDVYIDCEWCDMDFIKTEIPFMDYVIDRAVADIHILVTAEQTASGGTEYTIVFIGQRNYTGMNDTLTYVSASFDTEDIIRRNLVKKLKLGFMRYIAETSVAEDISILVKKKAEPVPGVDKWKNWVFSISAWTSLDGEQLSKSLYTHGSFSISRITDEWKIESSIFGSYDRDDFEIDDTTTYTSKRKSYSSWGRVVRSIDDHWSASGGVSLTSSTYSNEKRIFKIGPGIEYNIFPYSQATSRELRIQYKIVYTYHLYEEETIYDKIEEKLFYEGLSITLDTKQRWGSISTTLSGSHYFHDFTKYKVTMDNNLSLRLIKGFSLNLYGSASWVHDQLSLTKRGLTPEEIILKIKEQATQYNYYMHIGITYTFGSLYSNIVNPRFGS